MDHLSDWTRAGQTIRQSEAAIKYVKGEAIFYLLCYHCVFTVRDGEKWIWNFLPHVQKEYEWLVFLGLVW